MKVDDVNLKFSATDNFDTVLRFAGEVFKTYKGALESLKFLNPNTEQKGQLLQGIIAGMIRKPSFDLPDPTLDE